MSTIRYALLSLLVCALAVSTAFAQEDPATLDGKIQVKLTEQAKADLLGQEDGLPQVLTETERTGVAALDQLAQQYNVERMERVFRPAGKHEPRHVEWGLDRWYILNYESDADPETVASNYLAAEAEIESASPMYEKAKTILQQQDPGDDDDEDAAERRAEREAQIEQNAIPNDPEYSTQWHYNNTPDNVGETDADINLPGAHDIETGDSDVIVSLVDSGLDLDHPDIEPILWTNEDEVPGNGVDDDNNGFVDDVHGYDHVNGDGTPESAGDDHGVHVGGTVAAKNGNGQFGAGVAGGDGSDDSGVRLMSNKTFQGISTGGFPEAIVYGADNGAVISQNSWGYTSEGVFEQAVLDAIDYFRANAGGPNAPMDGGIFVNAAGNSDDDGEWYPGFYDPSYAVSATEATDSKAAYSNFGDWIDVAAPGGRDNCVNDEGVWSTVDGGFGCLWGTSMAAPHVSGVIGLVVSANEGLTNDQVEQILKDTGADISDNQSERMGPRVDAQAAVAQVSGDETPPAAITDLDAQLVGAMEDLPPEVFISEVSDSKDGNFGNAFLEIYNNRATAVDLEADDISIRSDLPDDGETVFNFSDGSAASDCGGTIASGETLVIGRDATQSDFEDEWGDLPDSATFCAPFNQFFVGATARIWEVREGGQVLDDTGGEAAGGSDSRAFQVAAGSWTYGGDPADATPGTPDFGDGGGGDGLFAEPFDDESQFDVPQGETFKDGSDFLTITDGSDPDIPDLSGNDGTYLAAADTDSPDGVDGPSQLLWSGVDISGESSLEFVGAFGASTGAEYDGPDSGFEPDRMELEYRIDGGEWKDLIAFWPDGTGFGNDLREDTDFDGVGDGTQINTGALSSFTKQIGDTGSTLDLRMTINSTLDPEDFAADEFKIQTASGQTVATILPESDGPGAAAELSWTAPGDDGNTGTASEYDVRFSTDGAIEDSADFADATRILDVPNPEEAGTEQSFTVDGLPFDTETHFAIRTFDAVGNESDLSNSPSVQTQEGPVASITPDTVSTDVVIGETATATATLSNDGSVDFTYDIDGAALPDYLSVSPASGSVGTGESQDIEFTFDAGDLNLGQFEATVEATLENGNGETAIVSVETLLNVDTAPFPFTVDADPIQETLQNFPGEEAEEATRTITITNDTNAPRDFAVLGGAAASEDVTPFSTTPLYNGEKLRDWQRKTQDVGFGLSGERGMEVKAKYEGNAQVADAPLRPNLDVSPSALGSLSRLTGNSTVTFGNGTGLEGNFIDLPIDDPSAASTIGTSPTAFAGNYGYGREESFFVITDDDNAFHRIDNETGEITTLGTAEPNNSYESWNEIAPDPTEGTLYAGTTGRPGFGDPWENRIYELDPQTGEAQLVTEVNSDDLINAYAIDGNGQLYGLNVSSGELVEIDKQTGEVSSVGLISTILNFEQGMDFDLKSGKLFMSVTETFFGLVFESLIEVDPETGDAVFLGATGGGAGAVLGYLALPSVGFAQPSISQGTLSPGSSIDVDITLNAERLNEDTYDSDIIVKSNVAGEPTEEVSTALSVDGQSRLAVTPAGDSVVTYDSTFTQDTSATEFVTIRNTGTDDMEATLSIGDQFTASTNSVSLIPGEAATVGVAFTPTQTGEFSQALTVESGDSTDTVDLEGVALPRPVAELSQSEFDVQMFPGQQYTRTLTMENTGGDASDPENTSLEFVGMEENVITPEAIAPPAVDENFEDGVPPEGWQAVDEPGEGVEWKTNEEWGVGNWTGDGLSAHVDSDQNINTPYDARLISPEKTFDENTALVFSLVFDQLGQSTFDVDISTDGGSTWETVRNFEEDIGDDEEGGGELVAISNEDMADFVDLGDTFQVRFRFWSPEAAPWDWYAQIDDVSFAEPTEFFAFEPTSGEIAPGESEDLTLSFDATNLASGTYEVDMVFETNDPAGDDGDGTITVPVTIDVIENVTMTLDTGEDRNPTEEFTMDFNVESLDDLAVSSYDMTMNFPSDSMQVQDVVTEGTLSEGVTLSSNIDNENGTLTVSAFDPSASSESADDVALFDIEGEGTLISADVKMAPESGGNPKLGQMEMNMEEMTFNEGNPPVAAEDHTMEIAPLFGDVDINLFVNIADAVLALDASAGNEDLFDAQSTQADVSGDGNVSAFDASLIAQFTVGEISSFPVADDSDTEASALAAKSSASDSQTDASLAWGEITRPEKEASGTESSTLKLPLVLDQAKQGIYSLEVSTELDPDVVSVEDVKSQLPDSWRLAHHVSDDGTLNIAMAGPRPLTKTGKVTTLTLSRENSDAAMEVAGNVAINEDASTELSAKSLVNIPDEFALEGAYPNPFRQSATLEMDLPKDAGVTVEIYDLLGRKVQTAHNGELSAGAGRTVRINGSDLSSGTYFYRARVKMGDSQKVKTGKMTVVR